MPTTPIRQIHNLTHLDMGQAYDETQTNESIKDGDSVLRATVVYPSTQAADGVRLGRLIGQNKSVSDLVSHTVPRKVQLFAPIVTKDNVDEYIGSAFDS